MTKPTTPPESIGKFFATDKIWITKDLREIPLHEMANSHLNNTIALLERRKNKLEQINDPLPIPKEYNDKLQQLKQEKQLRELVSSWSIAGFTASYKTTPDECRLMADAWEEQGNDQKAYEIRLVLGEV